MSLNELKRAWIRLKDPEWAQKGLNELKELEQTQMSVNNTKGSWINLSEPNEPKWDLRSLVELKPA